MGITNSQVYLLALIIISIIVGYITLFRNVENLAACHPCLCATNTIIESFPNPNSSHTFNNPTIPIPTPTTTSNNLTTTTTCTNIPSNILLMQDFTFYKNSNVCLNRNPTIIIFVHSAINYWMRRDTIRSTWGSVKKYGKWTIELVFMLGISSNFHENSSNKTITGPPDQDDADVVIGNFIDTYDNLTYKHLTGYKWVLQHCPTAKYIIKSDDDMFLDIFRLTKTIQEVYEMSGSHNTSTTSSSQSDVSIIGHVIKNMSKRGSSNEVFPDYVSGSSYVIRMEAACAILKIQNSKPFHYTDDAFVTGILRHELNLTIHGINSEYFVLVFPGITADQLISWYNKPEDESVHLTPSPWIFILLGPKFPDLSMVSSWGLWLRTIRAYGLSPGHGFND